MERRGHDSSDGVPEHSFHSFRIRNSHPIVRRRELFDLLCPSFLLLLISPFRWLSPDIAAFHRRAKTKIHWGCGDGDLQGVGEFSSTGFYLCSSDYAFGGSTTFTRGSRSGGSIDLWRCQRLERRWRGWRDCQHQEY